MALVVSFRKALTVLQIGIILILMLIYCNQDTLKPISLISILEKSTTNTPVSALLAVPSEKTWTYKCESGTCVRHHYSTEIKTEKRVPFMTCSMTCGDLKIWPYPTIKSDHGFNSVTFRTNDIQLKIDTPFNKVAELFREAFFLFLKDLKRIQNLDNVNDSSGPDQSIKIDEREENFSNRNQKHCDIDNFIVEIYTKNSNEIYLNLDTDESFNITAVYEKRKMTVKINASTFFGARHGLSTLQQLIWYDDEDKLLRIVSKFTIFDAPKFKYRGLMLDTSRHYFSVESIKRTLAGMSHAKLNRFHWHITDSQSFPFVSKYYPELADHGAYSERETYTSEDVKEIVNYAKLRGIQVIPEIDAPAHAGNGWGWGPEKGLGELGLCINQQPWRSYCGEPPCGQLNPKNNNTYLILQTLYEELLNLMGPTDYFHLGGDEVNLKCWGQYFKNTDLLDLWCDFMLEAYQRFKIANQNSIPKYVSVWSSQLIKTKCLSPAQFVVQSWGASYWNQSNDLLNNGFNLIISHIDAWYLDCGLGSWAPKGGGCPYRKWQDIYKHRPWDSMGLDLLKKKQILGGEVCLWTELVDESDLDLRLWPRTAALGERLWADPDNEKDSDVLPEEVSVRMSVFRNRLIELGIKALPLFPKYCKQNPGECV